MIRLTRAQVQPIGLDIGHESVRLLQMEVAGGSLSVFAAAQAPLPAEAASNLDVRLPAAMGLIGQLLGSGGFSGRRVVANLPSEFVHIKNLRLPRMPAAELEAAVQLEARNLFEWDMDAAVVRHVPVGEVRQGGDVQQEVIVVAVRRVDLGNYLEQLHRAGAVVDSLDVEMIALFRSVERFIRRREDEQEVNVLVDGGLNRSRIVIGKGRDISFYKTIDIGGAHLHQAISGKLGISTEEARALLRRQAESVEPSGSGDGRDPVRQAVYSAARGTLEELGREVTLCLRYHSVTFRGHRPTRVRLVGGLGADPMVVSTLGMMLPLPVEAGRPLHSVNTAAMQPQDRRGTLSGWAMALGLGLRRTEGKFGARDGRPRDPSAPREDLAAPVAAVTAGVAAREAVAHA